LYTYIDICKFKTQRLKLKGRSHARRGLSAVFELTKINDVVRVNDVIDFNKFDYCAHASHVV